jgi:hypothetical protein
MPRAIQKASKIEKRITVQEALANPKILKGLTKECFACDPYNPTHVERSKCRDCKGTGFTSMEFAGIVRDAKGAQRARDTHTANYFDEDE